MNDKEKFRQTLKSFSIESIKDINPDLYKYYFDNKKLDDKEIPIAIQLKNGFSVPSDINKKKLFEKVFEYTKQQLIKDQKIYKLMRLTNEEYESLNNPDIDLSKKLLFMYYSDIELFNGLNSIEKNNELIIKVFCFHKTIIIFELLNRYLSLNTEISVVGIENEIQLAYDKSIKAVITCYEKSMIFINHSNHLLFEHNSSYLDKKLLIINGYLIIFDFENVFMLFPVLETYLEKLWINNNRKKAYIIPDNDEFWNGKTNEDVREEKRNHLYSTHKLVKPHIEIIRPIIQKSKNKDVNEIFVILQQQASKSVSFLKNILNSHFEEYTSKKSKEKVVNNLFIMFLQSLMDKNIEKNEEILYEYLYIAFLPEFSWRDSSDDTMKAYLKEGKRIEDCGYSETKIKLLNETGTKFKEFETE